MKKLLTTVLLALFVMSMTLALTGCEMGYSPRSGMVTMMESDRDRNQRIARFQEIECRELVEDWDYFWLIDEPSQLTPWYVPDPE